MSCAPDVTLTFSGRPQFDLDSMETRQQENAPPHGDAKLLQQYRPEDRETAPEKRRESSLPALFNSILVFIGTAFAFASVVFGVLSYKTAVQAEHSTIIQNQIALLQYCSPTASIPEVLQSICSSINSQAATAFLAIATSTFTQPSSPPNNTTAPRYSRGNKVAISAGVGISIISISVSIMAFWTLAPQRR